MMLPMARCRRRLALLWFVAAALLFLILFFQTIFGHYGNRSGEAWGWLLPSLMPTLSLMVGVLATDAAAQPAATAGGNAAQADPFFFRLAFSISAVYLGALLLLMLLAPVAGLAIYEPLNLMTQSNLWLGPFQGLVTASIGAFFVKRSGGGGVLS